jgi:hypothetical protein
VATKLRAGAAHACPPSASGPAGYERRRPEASALYEVVRAGLESFLARARAQDRTVPRFVERELRAYLGCGILAHGFVRVRCDACRAERLVAFSCKGRGFCPSCGGRRMADTAAHLVDRVLPEVPIRQWVLSLPFALRYRLAYDARLACEVLSLFVRAVFASLRRRARRKWGVRRGQCGAVTFVQRFGDALNLNVHFHSLVLDGVYEPDSDGAVRFRPLPPPADAEVERVARRVARSLARLLERRGLGPEADPAEADPLPAEDPLLAALYAASVAGRAATGPRAGRRVVRLGDRIDAEDLPLVEGERCTTVGGVSLHANVAVPARDRLRLEKLQPDYPHAGPERLTGGDGHARGASLAPRDRGRARRLRGRGSLGGTGGRRPADRAGLVDVADPPCAVPPRGRTRGPALPGGRGPAGSLGRVPARTGVGGRKECWRFPAGPLVPLFSSC